MKIYERKAEAAWDLSWSALDGPRGVVSVLVRKPGCRRKVKRWTWDGIRMLPANDREYGFRASRVAPLEEK